MSPGPTFDRVYLALKEQPTSGRFPPGDHLEPAALGEELAASITPVRDALHRLVGERLVEAPRNDGFRVPAPTEAQLRDLYAWNYELLALALRRQAPHRGRPSARTESDDLSTAPSRTAADFFRSIAGSCGNPEHEATIDGLSDRLSPLRPSEEHLFPDWADELDLLKQACARGDMLALKRGIAAYHRRRQRCVPDLLVQWRRLAAG